MNALMKTLDPWQWHETMRAEGLRVWALVDGSAGPAQRQRWRDLHGVMDEFATRLGRRIHVDAAGLPMMLRLRDPRVLRVLPQSLVPDTLPALLAFGAQALVPDRAGGHEVVALACPAEDPLAAGQMQLKPQELDALQHAAYPDALLGALREQAEGLLDTVPDEKRHALARGQWRACEDRRINGVQDHVLALSLAIEQVHKADPKTLRPFAKILREAWEMEPLKDEQIIAFFDEYVTDSLAGFDTDRTRAIEHRWLYQGGDATVDYAALEGREADAAA